MMRREYWIMHIYCKSAVSTFDVLMNIENIKEWIKRNYESGAIDAQLEQILHYHDCDEFIKEDFEFVYSRLYEKPNLIIIDLVFPEETYHPFAVLHFDIETNMTTMEWKKTDHFYS